MRVTWLLAAQVVASAFVVIWAFQEGVYIHCLLWAVLTVGNSVSYRLALKREALG